MLDELLREIKDKLVYKVVNQLPQWLSPNLVTLLSLVVGLVGVVLTVYDKLYLALLFCVVSRLLDGLDGAIARITNQQTHFGGHFDLLADFIIYTTVPLALALNNYQKENQINIFIRCIVLEAIICVNSVSVFHLAAILEKYYKNKDKQQTCIKFPISMIEATETYIFYFCFYVFNFKLVKYLHYFKQFLFDIFSMAIVLSILVRTLWACRNIK